MEIIPSLCLRVSMCSLAVKGVSISVSFTVHKGSLSKIPELDKTARARDRKTQACNESDVKLLEPKAGRNQNNHTRTQIKRKLAKHLVVKFEAFSASRN